MPPDATPENLSRYVRHPVVTDSLREDAGHDPFAVYERTLLSLDELAERFAGVAGCSRPTLARRAKAEGWAKARADFRSLVDDFVTGRAVLDEHGIVRPGPTVPVGRRERLNAQVEEKLRADGDALTHPDESVRELAKIALVENWMGARLLRNQTAKAQAEAILATEEGQQRRRAALNAAEKPARRAATSK